MKKLVAKGAASLALLSLSALPVLAQDAEAAPAVTPEVAYIFNTLLFLIGGFLVMWMAAGFAMLEAGLVRSKNVSMQCLKNISLYSIAGLMFWITGYNLMYTGVDGGFMGSFGPYSFDPVGGERLSLREGPVGTLFEGGGASALADFMVDLHVRLHLPHPWGLLLTGVLGLAMLVAAVTGFLLHRHLIRELFTLRRRGDALLTVRDVHVIAGTWNLPFAFLLAFTGSYFSFGSAFGIPAVAMIAFEGDQERLVETVIGEPPDNDPRPAAMADFDALIRDVRERSGGTEPAFVQVAHWGRADAQVTFLMAYPDGALTGPTYLYNGASGDFLRTKPVLGQVPSVGSTVFELMTPLHFGNFAGVWSKALWFALGFAGAYVSFTGLRLWTRRRQDAPGWAPLARATLWVGYGLPLALVASAYGYFPARDGDAVVTWMFAAFFLAAAAAAVPSFFASAEATRRSLLFATGVAMAGLPVTRMVSGGASWPEAMAAGWTTLPAMDTLLVLGAVLCLWTVRRPGAQPAANETLAHEH